MIEKINYIDMEFIAKSQHLRQSPTKMRQVVDLIRGKKINDALNILRYTNKKASMFIYKTVQSGVASIVSSEKTNDIDQFFIKTITVDGGPVFKRWRPAAYGRSTPRLKRTSHLTVIFSNKK